MRYRGKEIDRKELMRYVREIDSSLKGYQRRISLYAVGGTALTLIDRKFLTKDIDFSVPRRDFAAVSEKVADIIRKEKVNIDVFIDGELSEYMLPENYQDYSRKISSLRCIDLYVISKVDLFIMKAVAGREKDIKDLKEIISETPIESVRKRFEQLKFKAGKKENLKKKLEDTLKDLES